MCKQPVWSVAKFIITAEDPYGIVTAFLMLVVAQSSTEPEFYYMTQINL